MIALVLAFALAGGQASLAYLFFRMNSSAAEERRTLINHILADTPQQFATMQITSRPPAGGGDEDENRYRAVLPLGL